MLEDPVVQDLLVRFAIRIALYLLSVLGKWVVRYVRAKRHQK